ncbi:helix-hairpin-helix motif family protein [Neisseria gonorrhoeae]|nr:helix-hairpin-helix motif family protein [Neisseria gonorrhoeae]
MKKCCIVLYAVLLRLLLAAVNINAASQQELEALPGIGPAKAMRNTARKRRVQVCGRFDQGEGHRSAVLAKLKDRLPSARPHQKARQTGAAAVKK